MPTGYTAKLMEKGQTFEEFALTCARAFGALVNMREEPLDAAIPEEFAPDKFYQERLEQASAEYDRLSKMSPEQGVELGKQKKYENVKRCQEGIAKAMAENHRVNGMLAEVSMWKPPTEEHEGLKNFMREQLEMSLTGEWLLEETLERARDKTPEGYWEEMLAAAERDVDYNMRKAAEERKRAEDRTKWVRELRESLGVLSAGRV